MPLIVRNVYHKFWLFVQTQVIKHIILRQLKAKKVVLYLWQPYYLEQIDRFNEDLVLYHIADDYHYDSKKDHPVSVQERQIIEKSDIVFIHSKTLLEKKGHINKNTYYMPNGVDFELYRKVIEKSTEHLDDIANIPRPIIGYAGWIKRHLDLKLLLKIAQQRKDWSILLVGPIRWRHKDIHKDIEQLKKEENVYFTGCKEVEELPLYINAMAVCLMPYRFTPYTKYIYPLKLHEYLACGKPIVATRLPNLEEYASLISLADRKHQWIPLIEKALEENNHEKVKKRIETARENSWDKRVDIIQELFNQRLSI